MTRCNFYRRTIKNELSVWTPIIVINEWNACQLIRNFFITHNWNHSNIENSLQFFRQITMRKQLVQELTKFTGDHYCLSFQTYVLSSNNWIFSWNVHFLQFHLKVCHAQNKFRFLTRDFLIIASILIVCIRLWWFDFELEILVFIEFAASYWCFLSFFFVFNFIN